MPKHYVVADEDGNIVHEYYDAQPSGRVWHGNPANFYEYDDHLRSYPYFNNQIFEFQNDSFPCVYRLHWEGLELPDPKVFGNKNGTQPIMDAITNNSTWIRLFYIYETVNHLIVKYYIRKDLHLSVYKKATSHSLNVKAKDISNDMQIMGDDFPLPMGVYRDECVGMILGDMPDEENPILVFYKLK
jgi:hypothetical protein